MNAYNKPPFTISEKSEVVNRDGDVVFHPPPLTKLMEKHNIPIESAERQREEFLRIAIHLLNREE